MGENKADPGACGCFHCKENSIFLKTKYALLLFIAIYKFIAFLTRATLEICVLAAVVLGVVYSIISVGVSALSLGQERKTSKCQHEMVFCG